MKGFWQLANQKFPLGKFKVAELVECIEKGDRRSSEPNVARLLG
jgi:hypothetical protein